MQTQNLPVEISDKVGSAAGTAASFLGTLADIFEDTKTIKSALKIFESLAGAFAILGALASFMSFFLPDETQ